MNTHGHYVGVDGCHAGWVAVVLRGSEPPEVAIYPNLAALWEAHEAANAICIDMPIGLLDEGPDERLCEREARRRLGPRRSSVFPVPCREAVYTVSDDEAKAANRRLTGKGLSVQTLAIRRKIREMEELVCSDARARAVFREVHPEVLFWAMNGGTPMLHRKKSADGRQERRVLLAEVIGQAVVDEVLRAERAYLRRDLQTDDVLDALACVVAAIHHREMVSLPEDPPLDACGLRMEMVYWPRPTTGTY